LTDDHKNELRRREILTYRRKNSSTPPSHPNNSLPSAENVVPPPPPSVREFPPKTIPTYVIQLNIDGQEKKVVGHFILSSIKQRKRRMK